MASTGDRARSFEGIGAEYHRVRPRYAPDAVDWMVPAGARRVLDLGAGTGKLTDVLRERDIEVVAVDPSPRMLQVLADRHPEVVTVIGRAEAIPLPDNDFDAVVCGQAWQYVDPIQGGREVARVLRPGGRLALAWNSERTMPDWLRTVRDLQLPPLPPGPRPDLSPTIHPGPQFAPFEERDIRHTEAMAAADYVARCRTSSHWLTADDTTRAERSRAWADILAEHDDGALQQIGLVTNVLRTHLL